MMVLLGAGGTFKKWKLVEGREVTIGIPLKGILAFWPTFFLSLFPPPFLPHSAMHSLACPLFYRTNIAGLKNYGLKKNVIFSSSGSTRL